MMSTEPRRPSTFLAVVFSLLCPGLGQMYCGRLGKGLLLFLISLLFAPAAIGTALLPPSTQLLAMFLLIELAVVGVYLYSVLNAFDAAQTGSVTMKIGDVSTQSIFAAFLLIGVTLPPGLALLVREAAFEAYAVAGSSMNPSLLEGDHVLVNKLGRMTKPLDRGDVVAFRSPEDPNQIWIKRIVALPGDLVLLDGDHVLINADALDKGDAPGSSKAIPEDLLKVPDAEYYLLGDHRTTSRDSRHFGCIRQQDIVGSVDYVFWPKKTVSRLGRIDAEF